MFKATNFISILFVSAGLLIISAESVSATVGGPIYIERLSYSSGENALYYLINNQGGRGCPPEIEKMDLATGERTLVLPCDKIEATYYTKEGFNSSDYDQFIQNAFEPLTSLQVISLPKNDISVTVDYVGENKIEDFTISSDFQALIFQGGQKKETIDFTGCYKDQPNVFRGYMIPNTNKVAMIISRIGDCGEGGYTNDNVYVLDNINFQDTTAMAYHNSFSGPQVHQGDLVISAENIKTAVNTITAAKKDVDFTLVWGILALIAGLIVGYIIGRKTKG